METAVDIAFQAINKIRLKGVLTQLQGIYGTPEIPILTREQHTFIAAALVHNLSTMDFRSCEEIEDLIKLIRKDRMYLRPRDDGTGIYALLGSCIDHLEALRRDCKYVADNTSEPNLTLEGDDKPCIL